MCQLSLQRPNKVCGVPDRAGLHSAALQLWKRSTWLHCRRCSSTQTLTLAAPACRLGRADAQHRREKEGWDVQASQLQEQLWEAGQQVSSLLEGLLAAGGFQLSAIDPLHQCRYEGSKRLSHSWRRSPLCPRSVTPPQLLSVQQPCFSRLSCMSTAPRLTQLCSPTDNTKLTLGACSCPPCPASSTFCPSRQLPSPCLVQHLKPSQIC